MHQPEIWDPEDSASGVESEDDIASPLMVQDSPPPTEDSPVRARCSQRLVLKQPNISDWPIGKILEDLFHRGISPPTGMSHEELFRAFVSPADPVAPPSPPQPTLRKAKHIIPATKPGPSKRHRVEENEDAVLQAIMGIKESLISLNNRISTLENSSVAAVPAPLPGASPRTSSSVAPLIPAASGGTRLFYMGWQGILKGGQVVKN